METLIILNLLFTSILVGLIWTIQLVHYPSFAYVAQEKFSEFMQHHMFRITLIVAPLMLVELAIAILLIVFDFQTLSALNLAFVIMIWLSTIMLSMPCHAKLEKNFDQNIISKLVFTNWPRTFLWTAKLLLSVFILLQD